MPLASTGVSRPVRLHSSRRSRRRPRSGRDGLGLAQQSSAQTVGIIATGDVVYLLEQEQLRLELHGYDRDGAPLHAIPFDDALVLPAAATGITVRDTMVAADSVWVVGSVLTEYGAPGSYVCRTPIGPVTAAP
jgi:hypothetical protein